MARIRTSNTDRGRTAFSGFFQRQFRRNVRRLSKSDPQDGVLNTPMGNVPKFSVGANPMYATAFAGSNNDFKLTALDEGPVGEEVTIELTDPGAVESNPLSVSVNDRDISVELSTNAGDKATATITSDGTNVSNGDTVTIAGVVYTFQTTLTNVAGNVKIGADAAATLDNLKSAINVSAGAGTAYAAATATHPTVAATANTDTTQVVEALAAGSGGNSLTIAESSTHLTVGAFSGGGANIALNATAQNVVDAINADPDASELVTAANETGNNGTGLVLPLVKRNLVSGQSGEMRAALPPALAGNTSSPAVRGKDNWPSAPISSTATKRIVNRSRNRKLRKR